MSHDNLEITRSKKLSLKSQYRTHLLTSLYMQTIELMENEICKYYKRSLRIIKFKDWYFKLNNINKR